MKRQPVKEICIQMLSIAGEIPLLLNMGPKISLRWIPEIFGASVVEAAGMWLIISNSFGKIPNIHKLEIAKEFLVKS